MAGWKLPEPNEGFQLGKSIQLNGGFSSKPWLSSGEYPQPLKLIIPTTISLLVWTYIYIYIYIPSGYLT